VQCVKDPELDEQSGKFGERSLLSSLSHEDIADDGPQFHTLSSLSNGQGQLHNIDGPVTTPIAGGDNPPVLALFDNEVVLS
jgi:hypothetical protein